MKKNMYVIVMSAILAFAIIGCENEGTAEKTGKEIDKAFNKAEKEVNATLDTAKEKVEEAKKQ